MGEFFSVALGFPTAVLSIPLVVVVGYWVVVAFGALDLDVVDVELGFGLAGTPAALSLSLLTAFSWFFCLGGAVLLDGWELSTALYLVIGFLLLIVAVLVGLILTRIVSVPLRRLLPDDKSDSRSAFVGRTCVIRTSSVTQTFGQAEVTADDGSSALVQVRQPGTDHLTAGSTAVIFDYDATGEFFWVTPLDTTLGGQH
ncbi:hypothetical protein GCM10022243_63750 [Saccharothrix violaceirubra]|uniref:DUF1449 family protein n=1 Tax=Saccharothrix violaceirubra TaxID=413306 RepID=A0A7W7SXE1_9PSEU|nr:OB-fold-containig protein [Saccharothrix violaceirubra]MBB4962691.1 hypothetical protein [Saccharothrix violaceirubra]